MLRAGRGSFVVPEGIAHRAVGQLARPRIPTRLIAAKWAVPGIPQSVREGRGVRPPAFLDFKARSGMFSSGIRVNLRSSHEGETKK